MKHKKCISIYPQEKQRLGNLIVKIENKITQLPLFKER